jgi:hypothetical protein
MKINDGVCVVAIIAILCCGATAMAQDGNETAESGFWASRSWTEMYFEGGFSGYDDDNLIGDVWLKYGLHMFKWRDKDVDVYLKARLLLDDNRDFWNNRADVGAGVQYRPLSDYGLILFSELLYADYIDRDGEDANPYDSPFLDFRAGFAFWQWWGDAWWQVEGTEFYAPFTGWREAYADGLYYNRDDDNVIATADYKEGVMMTHWSNTSFDAYLNLEVATDANEDYWNNYVKFGPGIRWTPYVELDLKISLEYLVGEYYRGDLGDTSRSFNDVAITIAFWHAW